MMTPDEMKQEMQELSRLAVSDAEAAHCDADDLLCSVLRELGYGDAVQVFEKMHKWYV